MTYTDQKVLAWDGHWGRELGLGPRVFAAIVTVVALSSNSGVVNGVVDGSGEVVIASQCKVEIFGWLDFDARFG